MSDINTPTYVELHRRNYDVIPNPLRQEFMQRFGWNQTVHPPNTRHRHGTQNIHPSILWIDMIVVTEEDVWAKTTPTTTTTDWSIMIDWLIDPTNSITHIHIHTYIHKKVSDLGSDWFDLNIMHCAVPRLTRNQSEAIVGQWSKTF